MYLSTVKRALIHFSCLQVKIIFGENREQTGELKSIDGQEGVIKLEGGEITMVLLRYLCKMKQM